MRRPARCTAWSGLMGHNDCSIACTASSKRNFRATGDRVRRSSAWPSAAGNQSHGPGKEEKSKDRVSQQSRGQTSKQTRVRWLFRLKKSTGVSGVSGLP